MRRWINLCVVLACLASTSGCATSGLSSPGGLFAAAPVDMCCPPQIDSDRKSPPTLARKLQLSWRMSNAYLAGYPVLSALCIGSIFDPQGGIFAGDTTDVRPDDENDVVEIQIP